MEQIARDLRQAVRRLRMAPGFTLFAVGSLALGVGVSTAVYSAVRTLFWLPLGIPHQQELVAVTSGRVSGMSGLDFQDLRAQQSSFTALAASTRIRTALASTEGAEVVLGEAVSGEYFGVMQLGALRGRLLNAADERESTEH
jgi:putative ABC transport system permease protein